MACKPVCRLCGRLVISQSVTFTDGNLVVNIPEGSYRRGEKYCIVVAQSIPDTATINAPVLISVGEGTARYPLVGQCCAPVTACGIRTRTRYSAIVETNSTGGADFRLLGRACCVPDYRASAINGGDSPVTI